LMTWIDLGLSGIFQVNRLLFWIFKTLSCKMAPNYVRILNAILLILNTSYFFLFQKKLDDCDKNCLQ
jgi:hypothetical protein